MKSNILVSLCAVALLGPGLALAADSKVTLSGKEEVPAVETQASGSGSIKVAADKSVTGSIKTKFTSEYTRFDNLAAGEYDFDDLDNFEGGGGDA